VRSGASGARDKADGALQAARVELAEADGTIITTHSSEKLKRIAAITGLDFARFTKSMLLAQGGFAAFLNASPNERAELLEELTGTELYGELSRRVFEQARDSRQALQQLQTQAGAVDLLDEAERDSMQQQLANAQQQQQLAEQQQNWRRHWTGAANWPSRKSRCRAPVSSWTALARRSRPQPGSASNWPMAKRPARSCRYTSNGRAASNAWCRSAPICARRKKRCNRTSGNGSS
jgi:DNA repair exonuclease SbcCD ATPase subunit